MGLMSISPTRRAAQRHIPLHKRLVEVRPKACDVALHSVLADIATDVRLSGVQAVHSKLPAAITRRHVGHGGDVVIGQEAGQRLDPVPRATQRAAWAAPRLGVPSPGRGDVYFFKLRSGRAVGHGARVGHHDAAGVIMALGPPPLCPAACWERQALVAGMKRGCHGRDT